MVAREIKKDNRCDLFAATPPIEAMRTIVSIAASKYKKQATQKLMLCDVKRAYFYAAARRKVFVNICDEDYQEGDEHMCGELLLSMYGTRDAAQNWAEEYSSHLIKIGFAQGISNPCLFHHRERSISTMVHGGDYFSTADSDQLQWMKRELEARFEIKTSIIGGENGDLKKMRVLNRIFEWTDGGITYEPDARHAEIIVRDL